MESALCLGYNPQSIISLRFPSTTSSTTPWKTKLNFRYNHSSLWHSIGCKHRQLDHIFNLMPRAFNRLSSMHQGNYDEKGDNRIVRGAAGASLVLACALSIICFRGCKMSPKAIAGPKQVYQKAPPVNAMEPIFPVGGKAALESLLDVSSYLASSKVLPQTEPYYSKGFNFDLLPARPSKEDVETIKMEAVRLMKSGKPEEALELLYKACRKYKNDSEPAYNAEMALVEILICQGKFKDALEYQCLQDDHSHPSDCRIPLYKAIIYTMQDKDEEAKLWWKEFRKTIGKGINPSDLGE